MSYFLGIDLGGTVVKAAVFDHKGAELGGSGHRTGLAVDAGGKSERDIAEIGRVMVAAIRGALDDARIGGERITGIATTGHGKGAYILNRDGSYGPGIVSTDTRSRVVVQRINADIEGSRARYQRILQPLWPAHTASVLAWLKEGAPEQYGRIGHILLAKDLLRYFLTGEIATEITDISGTGLWNNVSGHVDDETLQMLGIPEIRDAIPPVLGSHERAGSVTGEIARETGLSEGTPVFGGLFDVNACALAAGLADETDVSAVVGTWSISTGVTGDIEPILASSEQYVVGAHCVPGQWMVHEASPTSASNLEWFTGHLLPDVPEADRFSYCNEVVVATTDTGVTFFPYLFGDDLGANGSGTFLGIRPGTDRRELIRAVYEGVAFQHARHLNKLLQIWNRPRRVRFAGGATRSDVWMQMFADVLDLPVTVSPANELGALGAAICAAVGSQAYPDFQSAMKGMTGIRHTFSPDRERSPVLRARQQRFSAAVHDMIPVWKRYSDA